VAMDNEPLGGETPQGPERPVRLGPTALEYEVPEGPGTIVVKYSTEHYCYVSSIS